MASNIKRGDKYILKPSDAFTMSAIQCEKKARKLISLSQCHEIKNRLVCS